MLAKQYLLFPVAVLLFIRCFSQTAGYKQFSLGEAGINTKIFSLHKTKQGYLYAGSSDGFYRFDGEFFKKIMAARDSVTDTVTAIYQDSKGVIWAGFQNGNIGLMDKNRLTYIQPEEGTPKKKITCFAEDINGNLWIATAGEGIYYFKGKRLYLINEQEGLTDLNIHSLVSAANGDMIAATDNGIAVCHPNSDKREVKMIGPRQGLPDYMVTAIAPAGKNQFWIGLQDKGFCLYNHSTQNILQPAAALRWNKGQVNSMVNSFGTLWIATQDSGLVGFDAAKDQLVDVPLINSMQKNSMLVTDDNEGNIWLAADNNKLMRSSANYLQVLPLYDKKMYENIHTILVDAENNIWTGADRSLIKYNCSNGCYTSKKYSIPDISSKTDITSIYQDVFGNIWIGTMGKGLYVLDPANGKYRQLKEVAASGSSSILSITGSGNTVCIAGLEGAMVFELSHENINNSTLYNFTSYNNIQNIGSTYIYNVFKDSKGRLWFATDGKGLTLMENNMFFHFDNRNGIKDNHIYSITEDKSGRIWFSTSNAGIYAYDGKKFTNYTLRDGLSNLAVSTMLTDKQGNIIAVHPLGLDIINPATGNFSYINTAKGIAELNTDLGAACRDAEGNIYAATETGILKYTSLAGIQASPETMIENIELFSNEIDTAAAHTFKYDENNFTFNYSALYYSDPANIYFQYKLEGLDTTWQLTTDDNKSFPKLPPGKYVFKVRSSLNKNFSHADEAAYAFEIIKPFWKQLWFILLSIITGGSILYWFVKARESRIQHVERLRQEKIEFEFQVLRNQVNPHFLFNSFNTLISTIEEDPQVAVQYVEQLSDFFRNIVTYRDKDLITLEEEMELLQTYVYLQQKRYGDNLALKINISQADKKLIQLPPLTLQLLVENAIKHNAVSKESKLTVNIEVIMDSLVIKNNLNHKSTTEKSTGMGLQNIMNRYALLTERKITIEKTKDNFTVSLPILK